MVRDTLLIHFQTLHIRHGMAGRIPPLGKYSESRATSCEYLFSKISEAHPILSKYLESRATLCEYLFSKISEAHPIFYKYNKLATKYRIPVTTITANIPCSAFQNELYRKMVRISGGKIILNKPTAHHLILQVG